MSTVWVAENVADPRSWERFDDVENINELLASRWTTLPANTRIYYKYVAESCDVTPHDEASIDRLEKLHGNFFVMCYPAGPILIIAIIAVVLAAVAIAAVFLFRPNSSKANSSSSPNNSLSERQNTARPNERIPDIVGCVRSIPDEIQSPYRIFIGNQEVEYGYYCVGHGKFQISQAPALLGGAILWDIKEDTTPIQQIDGSSVAVYDPNTSPNSGGSPALQLGPAITQPIINISRSSSVIGQILRAPNVTTVVGTSSIRATASGTLECNDSNVDFTALFGAGDTVTLDATLFVDPGGIHASVALDGAYTALTVTSNVITLATVSTVNANWSALSAYTGSASTYGSPRLTETGNRWVGPFVLDVTNLTEVWCNFVAPNGLFKISSASGNQYRIDDVIEIEITPLDANYNPIGTSRYFSTTVIGSASLTSQRASTLKAVLPLRMDGSPAGRVRVRAQRLSPYDPTWLGTNADQIQWRDLFAVSPVTQPHFGDVTTIQTMTYATASALVAQQRKLNLEVTRMIPVRTPASPTKPDLTYLEATRNAADIACFLARDPYLGNRPDSEIDFDNVYGTLGKAESRVVSGTTFTGVVGEVAAYFGTPLCAEFCYTFDDIQTTFEEMMIDIGQAVFCTPYRRASKLSFFFEKLTSVSTLLFNHRNKLPGTETRTVTFGLNSDFDGIELDYIDPAAPNYPQVETTVTLSFPTNQSATNPKKIKSLGIRNNIQAQLAGWRYYQKLQYQFLATEFKSTDEAALVINTSKILVADNTRPDTQDGDVVDQAGLILTLSQPVKFTAGRDYVIFLQHYDGTVENIPITAGSHPFEVVLAHAPALPLVLDPNMYARTTYLIAGPPNLTFQIVANVDYAWDATNSLGVISSGDFDFTDIKPGDSINLQNATAYDYYGMGAIPAVDISGIYTITDVVSAHQIKIDVDWSFLLTFGSSNSAANNLRCVVIRAGDLPATPFLLTQKKPEDGNTYSLQAVNSDDRYYDHDSDYINGVLALNVVGASDSPFPATGGGGGGSV